MATYIKDDSLENLNRTLQFIAQNSNAIRNANLDENIARNRQGLNDIEKWTISNPFAREDIKMKEMTPLQKMLTTASQDQGAILAEMKATNPDMYNYMIKQEAGKKAGANFSDMPQSGNPNAIQPYETNIGATNKQLKSQGKEFRGLIDLYQQGLEQNDKVNSPILQSNLNAIQENRNAAELNKNNIKAFSGNEGEQQQELIRQTHRAIKAGGGMEAYNQYLATQKAIDDHYQHNTRPLPPAAFFGSGGNGGRGGGSKKNEVYIRDENGKIVMPLKLSDDELNDPEILMKTANKYGKALAQRGVADPTRISFEFGAGSGKNPDAMQIEEGRAIQEMREEKELDKYGSGIFTFESTKRKRFNEARDKAGNKDYRYDPETGTKLTYDEYVTMYGKESQPAAAETKKEVPKKDYKKMGLW